LTGQQSSIMFSGCGIAGALSFKSAPFQADLDAMIKYLKHRGPDDHGLWKTEGVQLGHTRLSILDLSLAGHQPMRRKTAILTFNGEIYNFQQIREVLLLDGIEFASTSDTEVLIYAYLKWGTDVLERLNGFFSFAIWDEEKDYLFIATDRLGVKPLYYYADEQVFCFGSEVEALLRSGAVPLEIDYDVAVPMAIFTPGLLDLNKTPIKGVYSLTPGHYMIIRKTGDVKVTKYWELPSPDPALKDITSQQATEKVKELFLESVKLRMISDVPVCSFLSGGIDSSLITAVASNINPITSFCVSYGARNSDNEYSEKVVAHLGDRVNYKTVDIKLQEVTLEEIVETVDFSYFTVDSRILSLYQNYKAIKENGFKVVLNGQGADEVFAGYVASQFFRALFLDPTDPESTLAQKLSQIVEKNLDLSLNNPSTKPYVEKLKAQIEENHQKVSSLPVSEIEKTFRLLSQTTLRCWFRQEDFHSMRHSVECRVPFSDHHLVEYAFRLPYHIHYQSDYTVGKVLLRQVSESFLPVDVVNRPKQNFPSGDEDLLRAGVLKILHTHFDAVRTSPLVSAIYQTDKLEPSTFDDWPTEELFRAINLWVWEKKLNSIKASLKK